LEILFVTNNSLSESIPPGDWRLKKLKELTLVSLTGRRDVLSLWAKLR
jgi:hypothetical protein